MTVPRRVPLTGLAISLAATACQEIPRTYSTAFAPGRQLYADDFNREALGDDWNPTGDGARIEDGHLVIDGVKNHPLWLRTPLPDDVRIEFDTWTDDEEGDIKVEVAGDGHASTTSANYVASGYVLVFGGWNNRLNVLARQNEHGADRVSAGEPNVKPGRRYHFTIIRKGSELVWDVDGRELLRLDDPKPLRGDAHRHFAFSGWESEVVFDNLVISSLADAPGEVEVPRVGEVARGSAGETP